MERPYRIGIIGYAHSHIISNARAFFQLGNKVSFVAAADVPPLVEPLNNSDGTRYGIMKSLNREIGIEKTYSDYTQMLDEQNLDIALVCADNAFHGRVCEEILRRGIHVVMEKPMATSMQDAMRIARAAKEGNAAVVINWPTTWQPAVRLAHKLCQDGEIGRLFKVTFRNSDSLGPLSYGQQMTDVERGREWWYQSAAGGGALLDYCCYGACLSCWFFGEKPVAAYGMKANFNSPYGDAEDYATITAHFPQGVAIIEGSWTTVNTGIPSGPILYGLEGTMVVDGSEVRIYKTRHASEPDAVYVPDPLPEGRRTLGEEVLNHLRSGEPLHPTLSLPNNLLAMSILDAGIRSADSQKLELTRDNFTTIG
jgi:predicted dehydrogenase